MHISMNREQRGVNYHQAVYKNSWLPDCEMGTPRVHFSLLISVVSLSIHLTTPKFMQLSFDADQ
jgi:hypothetical protein